MEEWSIYLGEILVITALSGILLTMAPEGGMKKHVRFVISICVLAAIVTPMFELFKKLPANVGEKQASYRSIDSEIAASVQDAMVYASKQEIERSIASYLCMKFSLKQDAISVRIVLNTEDMTSVEITEIYVSISQDTVDAVRLKACLEEMFFGECNIVVSTI